MIIFISLLFLSVAITYGATVVAAAESAAYEFVVLIDNHSTTTTTKLVKKTWFLIVCFHQMINTMCLNTYTSVYWCMNYERWMFRLMSAHRLDFFSDSLWYELFFFLIHCPFISLLCFIHSFFFFVIFNNQFTKVQQQGKK